MNEPKITPITSAGGPSANNAGPPVHGFGSVGLETEFSRGIDFRHIWHVVQERLWIVVLCPVVGLVLALGYLARTPKLYQGHTVLEVEMAEPSLLATEDSAARISSMFLASQEALRTTEQNLTNRTLLARIIRAEGLADDEARALLGGGKAAPSLSSSSAASKSSESTPS